MYAKLQEEKDRIKQYQKLDEHKFFWYIFDEYNTSIYNLSNSHITMLMYLCTYLDYDTNYLKLNRLTYMSKSDLQNVLEVNQMGFYRFYNALVDNNILTEVKAEKDTTSKLKINPNIFRKGTLAFNEIDRVTYLVIKIYNKVTRLLYNSDISKKRLGYLFRLIPYLNKDTNALCSNPFEQQENKLKYLTSNDICKILRYSTSNKSKLIKELLNIEVIHNDNKQKIFKKDNNVFYINPFLFNLFSDLEKRDEISKKFIIQQKE